MKTPLWEGVYKSFREVPAQGPGFSGGDWLENSSSKLANFETLAKREGSVPLVTAFTDSLLPVVAGMVQGLNRSVRILDFGGGLGFSYYQTREGLTAPDGFEFCVVDIAEVCAEGEKTFGAEDNISFHSSTAEIEDKDFDIVHIGSSLQYLEDWRGQLASLCAFNAQYVLMSNIPAGDIETFATAQNYYGSRIPCWFFSVADLGDAMLGNDYRLIFKSTYLTKVYGIEQPYPLENFELQHRIEYPCMLLFQRGAT